MAVGTCAECGQEKELKNRTICEACRKRDQRAKKVGVSVSGSVGESPSSAKRPRAEQQPTTKNPDQWYIDYYENNTGQKVVLEDAYDRKCYVCKQPFKTRLELQKFCSLECRQFFLTGGKV